MTALAKLDLGLFMLAILSHLFVWKENLSQLDSLADPSKPPKQKRLPAPATISCPDLLVVMFGIEVQLSILGL
jgi:hypothetical protein